MTATLLPYAVHRRVVPPALCERIRRRLWLELRRGGITPQQVNDWTASTWWPHLRAEPELEQVKFYLEPVADMTGMTCWAETQILVRLPDEDGVQRGPGHVDELPPWAQDWHYRAIFGVELTPGRANGGGTMLLLPNRAVAPSLHVGDVLQMQPEQLHSGSPNQTGDVRMVLFYRLLEKADDAQRV